METLEFLPFPFPFEGRLCVAGDAGADRAPAALGLDAASIFMISSSVGLGPCGDLGLPGADGPCDCQSEKVVRAGDANCVIAGEPK
mmetsp:Transcript_60624/g.114430  ORF Transcript_60624/g.114430 Transcript_60624/m.114430 type:complete len:86 (+) Transcript_60624:1116-1373(+)